MKKQILLDALNHEIISHDYNMDTGFGNGYEVGLRKAMFIIESLMVDINPTDERVKRDSLLKLSKWAVSQKDCPPDFQEIIDKEFWNLI